jgi:hypothetical protein
VELTLPPLGVLVLVQVPSEEGEDEDGAVAGGGDAEPGAAGEPAA